MRVAVLERAARAWPRRSAAAAGRASTLTAQSPRPTADLFLVFVRNRRELAAQLARSRATVDRQTAWLIWPKTASGVKTDLNGNIVRETGLAAGLVDYKVCSVDDTWSGLAFKRRK